jgi:hypothetical protein
VSQPARIRPDVTTIAWAAHVHVRSVVTLAIVLLAVCLLRAQGIRPPAASPRDDTKRRQVTTEAEDQSPGVFTYHNDWARTGQNLRETRLTPATVTPKHFGRLKTQLTLDGLVYGQPLYAPGIVTSSGTFNLVIVATEHDTVYAFDADVDLHPAHWSTAIWQQHLVPEGATPAPNADNVGGTGEVCGAVAPEIGITSTPVIDPKTNTVYVVAKTKDNTGKLAFTLHALDLGTGLEQTSLGSPVVIDGSVAGNGIPDFPALNGVVRFDPLRHNQRAALALVNGIVYIGFASYCDQLPYYGWLFGYDTRNHLSQAVVFNTSPNGQYGGIWNSGAAPAIDSDGTMYLQVGNGPFDPKAGNWGDTILALPVDRETILDKHAFGVLDYFEPFNPQFLLDYDLDIGTGGTLLLPDQPGPQPHLLVAGGKQGLIYVLDRDQFTGGNVHQAECSTDALTAIASARRAAPARAWTETCDPVLQVFKNVSGADGDDRLPDVFRGHGIFSSPSYFAGRVYVAAAGDRLKAFDVVEGGLANVPSSVSDMTFRFPGVTTSISADLNQGGIVWAVDSGETTGTPGVLYAFDAADLSHVLYRSSGSADDQRAGIAPEGDRDKLSVGLRFAIPTVYDGKVFVVTQGELNIFALR